jgi:hypothetical protein
MRAALVAEGFFFEADFGLAGRALEADLDWGLDLEATGFLVEVAIKLRYHPASQVGGWASNRYMKIVRWIVAARFGPGRGVPPVRGLWLQ